MIKRFLDIYDDFATEFWPLPSYTFRRGLFVNPDLYEIKPREEYKKTLIESKEKELAALKEKEKQINEEIEKLRSG